MDKEHGENCQESDDLDGYVVYRTFGGLKHGRFAMENGSFKKDEVLAAVKQKKAISSGSSYHAAGAAEGSVCKYWHKHTTADSCLMGISTDENCWITYRSHC